MKAEHTKTQHNEPSISNLVGSFAPWQRNIAAFYFVAYILSTFNNLGITFHNVKTDYVCIDAGNGNKSLDRCHDCQQWSFNNSIGFHETITSAFELTCNREWLASLSQSFYQLGYVLSGLVIGYLSDSRGRRVALVVSIAAEIIAGWLLMLSPSIYVYIVARALLGFGDSGRGMCLYMLTIETVGPRHRTNVILGTSFGWVVGYLLMPLVAFVVGSFRSLQLLPTLSMMAMTMLWMSSLPESPRWLLTQQRYDEAREVLTKAAQQNATYRQDFECEFQKLCSNPEKTPLDKKTKNWSKLLWNRQYCWIVLILWFNFFANGFIYHGFSLNVDLLAGNVYLNVALSGLMEAPSLALNMLGMRLLGRRVFTIANIGLAGAAYFLAALAPFSVLSASSTLVCLSMLAKLFIFSSYNAIYIHAGEIFPTSLRHMGVSSCSIAARVGSIVAPFVREFTLHFGMTVTMFLFGGLALMAGMLTFFLPETKDKELVDQVEA